MIQPIVVLRRVLLVLVVLLEKRVCQVHRLCRGTLPHLGVLLLIIPLINIAVFPSINCTVFDSDTREVLLEFGIKIIDGVSSRGVYFMVIQGREVEGVQVLDLILHVDPAELGLRPLVLAEPISGRGVAKFVPHRCSFQEVLGVWHTVPRDRRLKSKHTFFGNMLIIL